MYEITARSSLRHRMSNLREHHGHAQAKEGVKAETNGWFKASRHRDSLELIRVNHRAYVLAAVIAHRARWRLGFNPHALDVGEALLGDHENYGMSEQQYRTAKLCLEQWGFATFRSTNRGTVGKLIDTRLFTICSDASNDQNNRQTTTQVTTQITTQVTTNEERESVKSEEPKKRLNDAASSDAGQPSKGRNDNRSSFRRFRENDIMKRLRTLLGEDEMDRAGGHWLKDWVRVHPNLLGRALDELEFKIREGQSFRNRAAWLEDLLKRWRGSGGRQ